MAVEKKPSTLIKNAITKIKDYRPPSLKTILNGSPKDPMSNVNRTIIDGIALGSSVALIGLLHANPSFFILPGLYATEMVRQPITALKKSAENGSSTFIKKTITKIKDYRPPPLKVIVNGLKEDAGSNALRGGLAFLTAVIINLFPKTDLVVYGLLAEGFRQSFLLYKKTFFPLKPSK